MAYLYSYQVIYIIIYSFYYYFWQVPPYFKSFPFLQWRCIGWFGKAMHLYSTFSSLTSNCSMQLQWSPTMLCGVWNWLHLMLISRVLGNLQCYCVRMCVSVFCGQSLLPGGSVTRPNQRSLGSGCLFPSQRERQQLRPHHYQQTPDWLPATCGCNIDLAVGRQAPKCLLITKAKSHFV